MDSVDGKHDFITIPNDRDSESMDSVDGNTTEERESERER